MNISPASSLGVEGFSEADPFASAGAYVGDVDPRPDADDSIEVSTPSADAGSENRLVDEMQSGVAGLEQRFSAFTQLLRRELTSLENRCAAALRSLFTPPAAHAPPAPSNGPQRFTGIVQTAAQRNHLDPALLDTVIGQESGFRPDVVSSAGAVGLMQLMPATARELGVSDPFDPAQNVEGGAKYLRSLLDRYDGRLDLALAAYNAGPGAVDHFGGVPPYKETQEYVSSIMSGYRSAVLRAG
ncbi:MAG TPA: lytic transglycosylase domain-containing protein [Candidatus Eremiobacteraceae bacterium]|nr:lytic transglycosylase domain-containing protein [Candidatus Eremiobacteraceae bacterium]